MKILFVGQLAEGQTSRMRMEVLKGFGHDVAGIDSQFFWKNCNPYLRKTQQLLQYGWCISKLNQEILSQAKYFQPDLLWCEKQDFIYPETLHSISKFDIKSLHYTPDPYFSLNWRRNKMTDACFKIYDFLVTSKQYEMRDYQNINKNVIYMPLGFCEKVHRPVLPMDRSLREKFSSDVAFVGGWAPEREALLTAVAKLGCKLKIWGYGWEYLKDGKFTFRRMLAQSKLSGSLLFLPKQNKMLKQVVQGNEIYADQYAWALSGASIALGFLRQVWPDQHTTRTFEIPACGTMMIANRTDEHLELFREGVEAEYFGSEQELKDKVSYYLKHAFARKRIAEAGYKRCMKSAYTYKDRLRSLQRMIKII